MDDSSGHTTDRVTLARLPSGVAIETTVHRYEGVESGPTVYVQAAQHGREINGTEVLRRVHDRLAADVQAGTVIAVPVANPITFDRVSYTTPEQLDSVNSNMNRVWPGREAGTLHQRMAARLWTYAADVDLVVDLHTGSPEMLPHVVYTAGDERSRELAEAFGTDLLLAEPSGEDAPDEWRQRGFGGKLRVAAANEGIPAITPELAHNKQFVESAIDTGITGLFNVLRELDVLSGSPVDNGETRQARNHLGNVDASSSGLFRVTAEYELGETVPDGATLGTVYDPTTYERLQTVRTDRAGVLYALTREATVTVGDRLAGIAVVD
ncbi:succinylglutamate desuccinylase/aspartoacylase family protein [Natranaeroarchaeum aerophilus]|uniref:Succinylglutamate desuccinylase/aspartoacylase family protein n=1 Tax=Natranaeroarchaeum aerophilus TaxID=2917711 RepID=A0AAE3FNZ8_9EURY|nr:succinylglutamate desuccinylase/aspartoacylase family protein [Natranaeroarchaeum aerophilus]MCL9812436.1 succinylglutamate desuccinylase/aspartoacylase family protein [Natranaeroarchaeum aerophilus]